MFFNPFKKKTVIEAEQTQIEADTVNTVQGDTVQRDQIATDTVPPSLEETTVVPIEQVVIESPVVEQAAEVAATEKPELTFFQRIKKGLSRTSSQLVEGVASALLGKKQIDDELLEELETQLLMADVGIDATTQIIDNLTKAVERKQLNDGDSLYAALQQQLRDLLVGTEQQVVIEPQYVDGKKMPMVILVVGVNGVGKTTTIGKLTKRLQKEGKQVMLAAGDTFRAAAVEQLTIWGERNNVPVVAQDTGADSASVIFDAVSSAQAKGIDVLIADTAGRLHNKSHLMDELTKVKRVMAKLDPNAPHEVLLVLDAGTGQNALSQAEHFIKAAGVTGLVLTKLDGTAKGGIVFALSERFTLPIRFIGVGEGIDDLQPFVADDFVDALFSSRSLTES
ncbi:MAG: fused signal recognition particle receptor [Candidatus Endobugula sp.]|jgi:fused signal recognition particle receptor